MKATYEYLVARLHDADAQYLREVANMNIAAAGYWREAAEGWASCCKRFIAEHRLKHMRRDAAQ